MDRENCQINFPSEHQLLHQLLAKHSRHTWYSCTPVTSQFQHTYSLYPWHSQSNVEHPEIRWCSMLQATTNSIQSCNVCWLCSVSRSQCDVMLSPSVRHMMDQLSLEGPGIIVKNVKLAKWIKISQTQQIFSVAHCAELNQACQSSQSIGAPHCPGWEERASHQ